MRHATGQRRRRRILQASVVHDPAHQIWSHKVHTWLQGQSVGLGIEDELDVSTVIGSTKTHYAQTWHQNSLSSVARYQPLQPEYVLAPYLSAVKGFKSRKLISRFRCGCHGLHVDIGRLLPLAQQVPVNVIVFSALLVQQRMNIILCLIVRHIVPSGTSLQTCFGAQPPHCLPFLLYMILKL